MMSMRGPRNTTACDSALAFQKHSYWMRSLPSRLSGLLNQLGLNRQGFLSGIEHLDKSSTSSLFDFILRSQSIAERF